jgi:dUTP pyrophosphatase
MNIISTQFTLQHNSFEIYVSGCKGSCQGCCNPELKDFNQGVDYKVMLPNIIDKVTNFDTLIKHIWILGGDPLDQNREELIDLIIKLKGLKKYMWIWTRYDFSKIPLGIKGLCDYIKCGMYDETQRCDNNVQYGITLATKNQKIYKLEEIKSMKLREFELISEPNRKDTLNALLPIRATRTSAGYDFASPKTYTINPNEQQLIWTNVKAYMQEGEVLMLFVRSSLSIKKGLRLANGTAIIDADYYNNPSNEGNIGICLVNTSNEVVTIVEGERIAQGIFMPFLISDNCNSNEERIGGIGSTNK